MPAAAVIPAPRVYAIAVAVKEHVANFLAAESRCLVCPGSGRAPVSNPFGDAPCVARLCRPSRGSCGGTSVLSLGPFRVWCCDGLRCARPYAPDHGHSGRCGGGALGAPPVRAGEVHRATTLDPKTGKHPLWRKPGWVDVPILQPPCAVRKLCGPVGTQRCPLPFCLRAGGGGWACAPAGIERAWVKGKQPAAGRLSPALGQRHCGAGRGRLACLGCCYP